MTDIVDPAAAQVSTLADQRSLCAVYQRTVRRVPDRVALRRHGDDRHITWAEYGARVERIARGLHALGLRSGGVLAMQLTNRPEFHLVDTAALHLGATTMSIYNTFPAEDIEFVLRDSGASVVVTESAFLQNLDEAFVLALRPDDPDALAVYVNRHGPDVRVNIEFAERREVAGDWAIVPADGSRSFHLRFSLPRLLADWLLGDDGAAALRARDLKRELLSSVALFLDGRLIRLTFAPHRRG